MLRHSCTCPHCGATHTHATRQPEPGDRTLCINCGEWCVFNEAGGLRAPTLAEAEELAEDHELVVIRCAWLAMNRRRAG